MKRALLGISALTLMTGWGQDCRAATPWDWISDQAIAVLSIDQPIEILDFFEKILSKEIENGRLISQLSESPFALLEIDEVEGFESQLRSIKKFLSNLDSAVLFSTKLGEDFNYCLVMKFSTLDQANEISANFTAKTIDSSIEKLKGQFREAVPSKKENREPAKAEEEYTRYKIHGDSDALGRNFFSFLKKILSSNAIAFDQYIIISNSSELAEKTARGIKKTDSDGYLSSNRRFLRSFKSVESVKNNEVSVYFVPAKILGHYSTKYDEKFLKSYGYSELVGAFGSVDFGTAHGEFYVKSKLSIPFTLPRTGVTEIWHAFRPIESIPDLGQFFKENENLKPERIVVSNFDSKAQMEAIEAIHRRNNTLEDLQQHQKLRAQNINGKVKLLHERENGQVFLVRFSDSGKLRRLTFRGHDNFASASTAMHLANEYENSIGVKKEKIEIAGYEGWFYNDQNLQEVAKMNRKPIEDFQNNGDLVTDRWTIHGHKPDVNSLLDSSSDSLSEARKLRIYLTQSEAFVSRNVPCWLEIRVGGARNDILLRDFRYAYYRTFMSDKYAKRSGLFTNSEQPIPIKTISDRMYSSSELVVASILAKIDADICGFSVHKKRVEWNWDWHSKDRQPIQ